MKKANEKISAAIIIIGNEILSGRTQDVNVATMSKWLNELGIKLEEVRVISDRYGYTEVFPTPMEFQHTFY